MKVVNEIVEYPRIVKEAAYGRVYEVEPGTFFPSVTTCLKYGLPTPEFLMKWMIEQSNGDYQKHLHANCEASEIGTAVHSLIERLLGGEEIAISDDPLKYVSGRGYYPTYNTTIAIRKGLQSFMAFWNTQNPEMVAMESLLFSTEKSGDDYIYPFCGRCDMIALINDQRWLLDIKTSKVVKDVQNYGIQLTMYKMLWDAMNPNEMIDRIGVIWAKKDFIAANPPKSVVAPIEYEYCPEMVHHVYSIFQQCYDGFALGRPRVREKAPKVFSLETSK